MDKKKLTVIIASVVALIVLVGLGVWYNLSNKDVKEPAVTTAQSEQTESEQAEETDAQTEKETQAETQTEKMTAAQTEAATKAQLQKMNKTMYCAADVLNVRSEPNTDSKVLSKLTKGKSVKVVGKYGSDWYAVELDGKTGYCFAKYLQSEKPVIKKSKIPYMLCVNRKQNLVIAYAQDENGEYTIPKRAMVCSVGNYQGETPVGTFSTINKYEWRALVGGVYGQYATRIVGHILFHSVPYNSKNKGNLDAAEYNKLGVPASHGCVRLTVEDAKWIYDNCPLGTTVKIYDSDKKEPLPKPTAAKIDLNSPNRGWDPTDPDPKNPWNR